MVIPKTRHGLDRMLCISAMQKEIRRAHERNAMQLAVEVASTDKAGFTMVCNRLEMISHEDVGLANPYVIPLVATCVDQAKRHHDPDRPGKWRMMLGNAIRAMCRSGKSREGDHFALAVGIANDLGEVPQIADYAMDMHTQAGRKMKRGLEHFRTEGAKLVPEPAPDIYVEAAYSLLAARVAKSKGSSDEAPLLTM